jgi:hypothetical protein
MKKKIIRISREAKNIECSFAQSLASFVLPPPIKIKRGNSKKQNLFVGRTTDNPIRDLARKSLPQNSNCGRKYQQNQQSLSYYFKSKPVDFLGVPPHHTTHPPAAAKAFDSENRNIV